MEEIIDQLPKLSPKFAILCDQLNVMQKLPESICEQNETVKYKIKMRPIMFQLQKMEFNQYCGRNNIVYVIKETAGDFVHFFHDRIF